MELFCTLNYKATIEEPSGGDLSAPAEASIYSQQNIRSALYITGSASGARK